MKGDGPDSQPTTDSARSARRWRIARRVLLSIAIMATLLAVFHTVENWRGKRAWEHARQKAEAKGEVLNWNAYMPKPVSSEQNFFAAPKMREWFVKDSMATMLTNQTNQAGPFGSREKLRSELKPVHSPDRNSIRLAVFHLHPAEGSPNPAASNLVLRLNDPDAPAKFHQHLEGRLNGLGVSAVSGLLAAAWPCDLQAIQIDLLAEDKPNLEEMRQRFLPDHARISAGLRLDEDGPNSFKVHLGNSDIYLATDYLELTEPDTGDLKLIRDALKRPLAQIEGDYTRPFESPIPNFVRIRTVAQLLADRAECHLLLKNPDAALEELTLLHDFSQRMNPAPRFLVSTLIHVAVSGLYTSVIQDGLRLHVWREPHLLALERQLRQTQLIPELAEALRTEVAASSRTFETSTPSQLGGLLDHGRANASSHTFAGCIQTVLIPRGWINQNRAAIARLGVEKLECFDVKNQMVMPAEIDRLVRATESDLKRFNLYTMLATIALPTTAKAVQSCARSQAMVNATLTASALERYRLNHGSYPEALDNLVPRYLAELPLDPIGGKPLRYRPLGSDFLLYSAGWNETDDGGSMAPVLNSSSTGSVQRSGIAARDWVWR